MNFLKKYEHKMLSDTLRFLGFTLKWGIHQNGYWLTNLNYSFDYMLSNLLIKFLKEKGAKSVIDVGCGLGDYVNEMNFHHIRSFGFDGNRKLLDKMKNEYLCCLDATSEYLNFDLYEFVKKSMDEDSSLNRKFQNAKENFRKKNFFNFDYVLCLNVGEYIPKKKEEIFFDNIDKLNKKGIILAWDIPGSFKTGTINEKNEKEIKDIFLNNFNYTYDEQNSLYIRQHCGQESFKNGFYIFEKKKM